MGKLPKNQLFLLLHLIGSRLEWAAEMPQCSRFVVHEF
jgi:hypothetical protein